MPYWGWILLIVGLSILAIAILYWALHLAHRSIPARQAAQGNPEADISAPISLDVAHADDRLEGGDALTARELEEERETETQHSARNRVATYEIAQSSGANAPAVVVRDLPPAELGEVLFHQGHFWRVDEIVPAQGAEAEGRLVVSPTTDDPKPTAA